MIMCVYLNKDAEFLNVQFVLYKYIVKESVKNNIIDYIINKLKLDNNIKLLIIVIV